MHYTGDVIPRIEYLNRLAKWRENRLVKVVSGTRGCGKTTLFALYIDWLRRSGVQDRQILFINMEESEHSALLHYQGLYSFIKKRLCVNECTYVFIDELQRCADYEKAIDGLLLKKQVDLYAAVSSACLFANTPYIEIRMLPLSFAEHLMFSRVRLPGKAEALKTFAASSRGGTAHTLPHKAYPPSKTDRRLPRHKAQMEKYLQREVFNEYVSFGGFPFAAAFSGDAGLIRQCVDGIYNTILVKDIARQAGINDIPLLEHIAQTMSRSIGHPLSAKKISTEISAKGRKIATNTVETYMRALTGAFVFYHAGRFDIRTGKYLKTLGRYYIADMGIRNLILETAAPDLDSQLENIVCMELLRRGFQVYIGKYGGDEINFVAVENGGESGTRAYFQVMATARDAGVLAGKLASLEQIPDNHPKYILSLDETPFRTNHNGIIRRNLIDWLLESGRSCN